MSENNGHKEAVLDDISADLDRREALIMSTMAVSGQTTSESAITAQVVDINDERVADGGLVSVDTVEIRRDGLVVAQVEVSSAQERAPYDRAVRRVGVDFETQRDHDCRELAERFANQRQTRTGAINELAALMDAEDEQDRLAAEAIETALTEGCRECHQVNGHHKLDCGKRS